MTEEILNANVAHVDDVPVLRGAPADWLEAERFAGRTRQALGKHLHLTQFGVNYTTLEPGAWSSLRHWHTAEDEFVLVLAGELTLVDANGARLLGAGAFCAFPAGVANAHHLMNAGTEPVTFLEVGSRRRGEDTVHYPFDPIGPIRR
ncbi:MAG: cupin domain-containing protein [Pseudomonadales bacterium]